MNPRSSLSSSFDPYPSPYISEPGLYVANNDLNGPVPLCLKYSEFADWDQNCFSGCDSVRQQHCIGECTGLEPEWPGLVMFAGGLVVCAVVAGSHAMWKWKSRAHSEVR
jgi:hypothetical protein